MVAGEPDKGINDPVVEELPWHPPNSGGGGSIFPEIQGEDEWWGREAGDRLRCPLPYHPTNAQIYTR